MGQRDRRKRDFSNTVLTSAPIERSFLGTGGASSGWICAGFHLYYGRLTAFSCRANTYTDPSHFPTQESASD